MTVPPKTQWKANAGGEAPWRAIDDRYATFWVSQAGEARRLEIDLGRVATLGGLEIYWGRRFARDYAFFGSPDGARWTRLCGTRHGEGGQEVFGFPATPARFLRFACDDPEGLALEIVEINLYAPADAVSTLEPGRVAALGHAPVGLATGESVTVDLRRARPLAGALIVWGERRGVDFSALLSDDGENFREVGRIASGGDPSNSFWWPSAQSRYFRLTLHAASAAEGAVVDELKLRVLDRDRMPIGQLERAARAGRGDLYPQSLLGRQVYWTALGEFDAAGEALFDEYGDLEPRRGSAQITPLLRLNGTLRGAPASEDVRCSLFGGSLPIPRVVWSLEGVELTATAFADAGRALVEYRVANRSAARRDGALALALRPVQINPYWQHGGHARIDSISVEGRRLLVNDQLCAVFSREPDVVTLAEFDDGDVVKFIENAPCATAPRLRSDSGLISAALEFAFALEPGADAAVVVAAPMRDGVATEADVAFDRLRASVAERWRRKIGPRRITVGDPEVTETLEAQIALTLVNAAAPAFRPGPRNYDRVWIRDGSAQAQALLWAGLFEEAKAFALWFSKRVYANGMVPPILDEDGAVNRGYGSDIEYDAQGEFVGVAAEIYRVTKDRAFLAAVFEPVVRAARFVETLRQRTNAERERDSRFYGLLPPSISHEGYGEPTYSYWDDFFALSAWRNCEYLASEAGETDIAAEAKAKGAEFAADLALSLRRTAAAMGEGLIAGSADRRDVDPTSTSIAFEPCRVDDVLPAEHLRATYDVCAAQIRAFGAPEFRGAFTPYIIRNLNAFVALGRFDDAFRLLDLALSCRRPLGWRHWAEVVWRPPRAPEYIGDMPHSWVGTEFFAAVRRMLARENGDALELFRAAPDAWWSGDGVRLHALPTAFGALTLSARRGRCEATVEMSLDGPPPARVTFRYPGAKRASADGAPCEIVGDVVATRVFRRLAIEF